MKIPIKFLKQSNERFAPLTIAEGVLVNHPTGVQRLDKVLKLKIEEVVTPVGSGLTSYKSDSQVTITHSNIIDPSVDELKPKLIKYDNRGHLIETSDFGELRINVNRVPYAQYDGSSSVYFNLGDDFKIDDGNIQIRWNTIT